jgi:hypothetical protein
MTTFPLGYNLDSAEKNRQTFVSLDVLNHPFKDDVGFRRSVLWLIGQIPLMNPLEFQLEAWWVRQFDSQRSKIASFLSLSEEHDIEIDWHSLMVLLS